MKESSVKCQELFYLSQKTNNIIRNYKNNSKVMYNFLNIN